MTGPRIAALALHPVKGCAGVALADARVEATGLRAGGTRDREWMVVDASGRFVTQRECPGLARVRALAGAGGLALESPDGRRVDIPFPSGAPREVVVWNDTVPAHDAGDAAAALLTSVAGLPVRLVRFDGAHRRHCNPAFAGDSGAHTLFADGYPVLVIGTGSLDALNRRLAARGLPPAAMQRFRPNVVVEGLAPHDEDHLATIEAGSVALRLVKPCTRCTVPNVDPATGLAGEEPLRTLAEYRMDERRGGVTFGMNAIVEREGAIAVGDEARVSFAFD